MSATTTVTSSETKELVREAVGMEWETFAARHPRLAAVLDRDTIIQAAQTELADDPEYRRAMNEATAAGMGAAALAHVVRTFIKDWLVRLF
jgi:hypothetical protein